MEPDKITYTTETGITIHRVHYQINETRSLETLKQDLNTNAGAIFISNYEYPDKYTQWNIGFKNPPLVIESKGKQFTIKVLNSCGEILLDIIWDHLKNNRDLIYLTQKQGHHISGEIKETNQIFSEEERLKKPSVMNLVKSIRHIFYDRRDNILGLYGSFGYDLIFGFEDLIHYKTRDVDQRDIVLYLPNEILVENKLLGLTGVYRYNFSYGSRTNFHLFNTPVVSNYLPSDDNTVAFRDLESGEYSRQVETVKHQFKQGNMFECVLSHTYHEPCQKLPSEIFNEILARNPAPYSFLLNLGKSEFLVGASPEMFVRVTDTRVETCPISGTIIRGKDALEESENILKLLNSEKECSELVMCTDIDRNDKSRICLPGTVRVITHREIEKTSRLIHTVDHVEGYLKPGVDAIDALCVHLWAVTVTGAPKKIAVEYIERHEETPRKWYGGAIGMLHFNGNINTGLTLRTIHLQHGLAHLRVGATLLYDSVPELEEQETELKASAFLDIIRSKTTTPIKSLDLTSQKKNGKILVIDFNDSFVHTVANYLKELVTQVETVRYYNIKEETDLSNYTGFIMSPGPKRPSDYPMKWLIDKLLIQEKPILGICLGHQAMVEYYGGETTILPEPIHGKTSKIKIHQTEGLFAGCQTTETVARYHSIVATQSEVKSPLISTSILLDDGDREGDRDPIVMSLEHDTLPFYGIQFHPESILTNKTLGLRLLKNFIG